jgi:hypothetical protein
MISTCSPSHAFGVAPRCRTDPLFAGAAKKLGMLAPSASVYDMFPTSTTIQSVITGLAIKQCGRSASRAAIQHTWAVWKNGSCTSIVRAGAQQVDVDAIVRQVLRGENEYKTRCMRKKMQG